MMSPTAPKAKKRITVILNSDDYDRFDRFCEQRGYKKSTLIARLVREHLLEERFEQQVSMGFEGERGS